MFIACQRTCRLLYFMQMDSLERTKNMIEAGMEYTMYKLVEEKDLASSVGSGLVEVFATPMMVALMEMAASECISQALQDGEVSVGTQLNLSHTNATPVGMKVWASAKVVAVNGRCVDFTVKAWDEQGEIGGGTHSRFIVNREKFEQKAKNKANKAV